MTLKFILLPIVYILCTFFVQAQTIDVSPALTNQEVHKIIGESDLGSIKSGDQQYNNIVPLALYLINNDPLLFNQFNQYFNENVNHVLTQNLLKMVSSEAPQRPACIELKSTLSIIENKLTIVDSDTFASLDIEQQIYLIAKASLFQALAELLGDIGESEIMAIAELIMDLDNPTEIYDLLKLYQHDKKSERFLASLILSYAREGNSDLTDLNSITRFWGKNFELKLSSSSLDEYAYQLDEKTMDFLLRNQLVAINKNEDVLHFLIDHRQYKNLSQYFDELKVNLETIPDAIKLVTREYYVGLNQADAREILLKQINRQKSLSASDFYKIKKAAEDKKDESLLESLKNLSTSSEQIKRIKPEIEITRDYYCTSAVLNQKTGYEYFDQKIDITDEDLTTVDAFNLTASKKIKVQIPYKQNDNKRFWQYELELSSPNFHPEMPAIYRKNISMKLSKAEFYHKSLTKPISTFDIDPSRVITEASYFKKHISIVTYFDSNTKKPKAGLILFNFFCSYQESDLALYKDGMTALGQIIIGDKK
ncbi:MAG: hypothetical protein JNM93_07685 [Bacteriovoracaceae bacterium]|nr:hypothetical protein [Bacteriovoracaceae bacterium]